MRDRVYEYLSLRPEGATVAEILDLLFTRPGRDPELGNRVVHSLLAADPRFAWDDGEQRWRLCRFEVLQQPVRQVPFTIIDLETTGLTPDPDGIIEIGAVRVEGCRVVAHFEQLVQPTKAPPPFIVRLTGITPEMLCGQPRLHEIWSRLRDFIAGSVVVAHNATFDLGYLNLAAQRFDRSPLTDVYLCTLKLARRLLPEVRRRGLDALAEFFGLETSGRHRALGDALLTVEIFFRLVERAERQGLTRVAQLLSLQEQGRDGRPFFSPLPKWQVESLPAEPGIYRFYDSAERLLYIGRAKNIRRRVRSYLSNARGHSDKTLDLIRHAHRVEAETTPNELEAALAEAVAIRREKPPYNKLGKHLPQVAYLRIGNEKPFPRLSVAKRPRGKTVHWIGPFRDRGEAERFLKILLRVYRLRTCRGRLEPNPAASPCFQGQVRLCSMPCTGAISEPAYLQRVHAALADLQSGCPALRTALEQQRDEASRESQYERAQRLHEEALFLERLQARFSRLGWLTKDQNFLLLLPGHGSGRILAYWIRQGQLTSRASLASPEHFDAWLEEASRLFPEATREAIDATTIVAGWLRERGAPGGYLFRVPADESERPATPRAEWRAACQALFAQPSVSIF